MRGGGGGGGGGGEVRIDVRWRGSWRGGLGEGDIRLGGGRIRVPVRGGGALVGSGLWVDVNEELK